MKARKLPFCINPHIAAYQKVMCRFLQLTALVFSLLNLTATTYAHGISNSYGAPLPELHYHNLPPLKEQATIQDAWTATRLSNIPSLLRKHGVDAWLISQREHVEDTVFWSMKSAQQFAARRRTTTLFVADGLSSGEVPLRYNWIDNTPQLWDELKGVLEKFDPRSIVVDVDSDIAFSGGLHLGESNAIIDGLGDKWATRLTTRRMLGVEYVATMAIDDMSEWYQKLQETAWAMINEGFSEKVITPGETTTEVCSLPQKLS